ncbi:C40 family peptidase [Streptomyces goshikiensis]|uniref:C40 family peptidase n=1 Tax=Streptomyces goshikiensis TaxID=1942 RepID=UPI00365C1B29
MAEELNTEPNFGGRLLGTNNIQRSADKVARDIDKFGANIAALNRALQNAVNSATKGAAYRGQPTQAFPAANQTTRLSPAPVSHPPANMATQAGGTFVHPTSGRVYTGPLADRLSSRYAAQALAAQNRVAAYAARADRQQTVYRQGLAAEQWGSQAGQTAQHLSAMRAAQDARDTARMSRAQNREQAERQSQRVQQQRLSSNEAARQYDTQRQQADHAAQMQRLVEERRRREEQQREARVTAQARLVARQAASQRQQYPGIRPELRTRFEGTSADRLGHAHQARLDGYYGPLFDDAIRRQDAANSTTWGLRAGQNMWAYNRVTGLSRSTFSTQTGQSSAPFYLTRNSSVINMGSGSGGRGAGPVIPPSGGFGATAPANNSGAGVGGTGGGSQVNLGPGLTGAYQQAVKYGDRMKPQMEEMDRYTNWAYIASGGAPDGYDKWGWKNQIRDHSYGTVMGKSTEDISNAQFLLDKNLGLTYGTAAQKAARGSAFGASYTAGLDAESGAKLMSSLYNPQASLAAQRLGYGRTIGAGGKARSIGDLSNSIMERTFGTSSISAEKFAAATASGQALDYNVDQLGKASGWDETTVDNLKEYMRGKNTLLANSEMSSAEADQLIAEAANTGKKGEEARKKLSKYGVSESLGQSRRSFEAQERNHDAKMGDSFAPAMENATKAVQKFESAINSILELPGIKQVVGTSGAWASVTKDPVGKIKGAWDFAKRLTPLSVFGGAGGGVSSGTDSGDKTSSATADHLANGNAANAITAALSEVGKPYVWGAEGPDAFDCSGLMQFAFARAGIKLPRKSEQQIGVGVHVDKDKIQPGDLLFPHPGHVMLALGGGKLVEAPRTGLDVRVRGFKLGEIKEVRRVASAVGALSSYNTGEKQTDDKAGAGNAGWFGGSGSEVSQEEVDALASVLAGGGGYSMGSRTSGTGRSVNSDSTGKVSSAPSDPKGNAALGKKLAAKRGWTGKEWDALYQLWKNESEWDETADNPTSDAYGIPQSLPGSKMASKGKDWRTNPATQIEWGLDYIAGRPDYGKPSKAWELWQKRSPHWYAVGAWKIPEDQDAVVHKGEMIIPAAKAETIRQALIKDSVNVVSPGAAAAQGAAGAGGGGIALSFAKGAIQISVNGAMTERAASDAAKKFVDYIAADSRIKHLGVGL